MALDDCKILLDCGWNDKFDVNLLRPLASIAKDINAVLITHSDTEHLGALPYAFGKLGMNCKVYTTLPVHKMGLMYMYDHFLSRIDNDFDTFTLDDVDAAFAAVVPVRYAQHSTLDGFRGVTVTPYAAGHMLGGAFWKIQKETDDVLYAVDYNHRKEKHLNGAVLESMRRPSLLITDAFNVQGSPQVKSHDTLLMDMILRCMRQDGNALIPIDPAGRVLELLLILEEKWAQMQLGAYQLVLLTTVAYNTLDFARSHLEWMGEHVGRNFDSDRHNVFNMRYLTLCHSLDEFSALRPGPKVVLASFGSLEAGPARHLFVRWASDPRNLIVLTDRMQAGSLSREVQNLSKLPPGARMPLQVSIYRERREGSETNREEKTTRYSTHVMETRDNEVSASLTGTLDLTQRASADKDMAGEQLKQSPSCQHRQGERCRTPSTSTGLICTSKHDEKRSNTMKLHRQRSLYDGCSESPNACRPMFDEDHWDPKISDYGEILSPNMLQTSDESGSNNCDRQHESSVANMLPAYIASVRMHSGSSGRVNAPVPQGNQRSTFKETYSVHLRAAVYACDYEGRADGRSMKTLLTHLEPRRVILVHGSQSNTSALRQHLQHSLPGIFIETPAQGQTVECMFDSAIYRLDLAQQLLSKTPVRGICGHGVGWVDGVVGLTARINGTSVSVLLPTPDTNLVDSSSHSDPCQARDSHHMNFDNVQVAIPDEYGDFMPPTGLRQPARMLKGSCSTFVGNLKLSDFKSALASADVAAEFIVGSLTCAGGTNCIRKETDAESDALVLDGSLSDDFYTIRSILYDRYQITA